MSFGVFTQTNEDSRHARKHLIGYILQENGCWDWVGARDRHGYGCVGNGLRGGLQRAHRMMYERLRGPIPPGLELDHLCRNPACVNPDHLEPVDHRTNVLRGASPAAKAFHRPTCKRGHSLDRVYKNKQPSGRPSRRCVVCTLANNRASRLRRRQ